MKLAVVTAHAGADSLNDAVNSWTDCTVMPLLQRSGIVEITPDLLPAFIHDIECDILIEDGRNGMLPAYQAGFERAKDYDVLAFLHDDTLIHESNWVDRVLHEFEDPAVGLVGFGGGTGHGDPQMYQIPYQYQQLARRDFLSNMRDAENHGRRFTGSTEVAVLDGFAVIFRREVLSMAGGWPLNTPIGYINYDYWACCMTHRLGYKIHLVGVECDHYGGRTFVKLGLGKDPVHWDNYLRAHEFIYSEFKDVLPWDVNQAR